MRKKFTEQEQIRREKLKQLKEMGRDPYYSSFKEIDTINDILNKFGETSKEELTDNYTKDFSIAGRVMIIRDQGKAMFIVIQENGVKFQLYVRKDSISEQDWKVVQLLDIGDITYSIGRIMKTNTGQLTLRSTSFGILTKALRPLPEKFHGLTDIEEIYRRRYIDLIMNKDSRLVFTNRTKIISSIRTLLDKRGFLEVETPVLQSTLGGSCDAF